MPGISSSMLQGQFNDPDHIYSIAETDTGKTWIDGKTVYRKCFSGTIPSTTGTINIASTIDTVVSFTFNIHDTTNDRVYNIAGNYNNPQAVIKPSADRIEYTIASALPLRRKPYTATIEYTKA